MGLMRVAGYATNTSIFSNIRRESPPTPERTYYLTIYIQAHSVGLLLFLSYYISQLDNVRLTSSVLVSGYIVMRTRRL